MTLQPSKTRGFFIGAVCLIQVELLLVFPGTERGMIEAHR